MTDYFPYSHIIAGVNSVFSRHPFFCAWDVYSKSTQTSSVSQTQIGEIYY